MVSRDGLISRRDAPADRRCAKIHRACKSSLSEESHATLTEADQALWPAVLLVEKAPGRDDIERIAPPSEFPLPASLGPPPNDAQVKWQFQETIRIDRFILLIANHSPRRNALVP